MKRIVKLFILVCFAAIFLHFGDTCKVEAAQETYQDNENGIITITYDNSANVKMKIGVIKDNQKYYYDLQNGKNELDIPLNMGNGNYTIKIFKNISGSKYSVVDSTTIDLELFDENIVFLQSHIIINFKFADKVKEKAEELTKTCTSEKEIVDTIYNYVVSNFSYDKEKIATLSSGYLPDVSIIYTNKKGICYDLSALLASMLRSKGIETKLVTGYTPTVDVYHAWNAIYDSEEEEWYTVDATYDVAVVKAGQRYTMKKKLSDYKDIKYQY